MNCCKMCGEPLEDTPASALPRKRLLWKFIAVAVIFVSWMLSLLLAYQVGRWYQSMIDDAARRL